MFQKNDKHLQRHLFSTLGDLPSGMRERLDQSWAGTFRREVFERLDETPFAVLYSGEYSRPNVPVNVLLGLEILKVGFGWTDEEMYDHFLYDLQVRSALGYEHLSEGYFAIRTLYEFRRRLSEHMQRSSENLVEAAFEQVTDEQVQALQVRATHLRMDSTQVASNIRQYSRLQLLVEVLQRVHRSLSEVDQARHQEIFAPYVEGKSSHFVYKLKKDNYETHLQTIGKVIAHLLEALAHSYGQTPTYGMLERVFADHFVWDETEQRPKAPDELAATSLQAPDDLDATFRRKQGASHRGFVTNITETCHPDNQVQLILKVHTEPNIADDARMLAEELPDLIQRTEVNTLYTDGGYNSPAVDDLLDDLPDDQDIQHIQTAIRGDNPNPDGLSLVDFRFETDPQGQLVAATCPQGERLTFEPGRADGRLIGRPHRATTCLACPLLSKCPVRPRSGNRTPALYMERHSYRVALKHQAIAAMSTQGNPCSAVEATVRSVKNPLARGYLRVRGLFRVACQMIGSAMMVNVRRIQRQAANHQPSAPVLAFFFWLLALWMRLRQGSAQVIHQFTRFPGTDRAHFNPLVGQRFSLQFYPAGNLLAGESWISDI